MRLISHADLVLKGSGVKAGGSIFVEAQNVQILAMQNTAYHYQMDEKWGFYASASSQQGSASVSVGWKDEKTTSSTLEGLAQVSSLEAGGNIDINARGDIASQGAIVVASGDLNVNAGGDINLESAYDTYTETNSHTVTQIGVTLSANENVSSAIDTYKNAGKAWNAGQGSDIITRGSTALQLAETTANLIYGPLVSVGVSVGASYSTSKSNHSERLARVGYWVGGQDLSLTSAKNVNIQGTAV